MKVFVIVDCQIDFAAKDGSLAPEDTVASDKVIKRIVENMRIQRASGTKFIWTTDVHDDSYFNGREGRHLPVEHCRQGTDGCKLVPILQNEVQTCDIVISKQTFGSLELADILKEFDSDNKVSEVVLVGFDTDICVLSNAIISATALPNATITVIANCCWGTTFENHLRALEVMKNIHIDIA